MAASSPCLGCRGRAVQPLLDFGPQPPSNRFEQPGSARSVTHPLVVAQCADCGLVQLVEPMPPAMAKSRFDWITYNEPEGHLDRLVERLRGLPGIGPESRIVGLTYKDDTTLARFNKLGHGNTYRYQAGADLGLHDSCAGLESIQMVLDEPMASQLAAKHGMADLLLVRHVIEHAHAPLDFLRAVKMLVKPGGYLVFEMPDCSKFVRACDHSFIWEEHITYFCAATLGTLLHAAGLTLQETILDPYPLEDSLIGLVRNAVPGSGRKLAQAEREALLADGRAFASGYAALRDRMQALFGAWRRQGRRVAIFGAGHLAAKFANMYSLGGLIECVIDDNPHKQALLMPGSRLPIRGSAALAGIDLCLLSLNPESEQKVLAKHQAFLERGGRFLSIFALSTRAVQAEAAP